MEIFKPDSNYNIIGKTKIGATFSGILILVSICALILFGLNYGVDFAGGTEIQLKFGKDVKVNVGEIRSALAKINLGKSQVQEFGDVTTKEYIIRIDTSLADTEAIQAFMNEELKKSSPTFKSIKFESAEDAYISFNEKTEKEKIKEAINGLKLAELELVEIKPFGKEEDNEFMIKFKGIAKVIYDNMTTIFGAGNIELQRVEMVGPKVGQELQRKGLLAVLAALFFILVYIAFRFDLKFAPGAIIALIHDVLITLGIFAIFRLEFNLPIVAAVLAIVGYSLNDTIVVYDRIRDNMQRLRYQPLKDVINKSINQTISRTVLTSMTTLLVTVILLVIGGRIIRDFAIALTIGVVIGTYSSIYVASPIVIFLENYKSSKVAKA